MAGRSRQEASVASDVRRTFGTSATEPEGRSDITTTLPTLFLVHGGFVDGSAWDDVRLALEARRRDLLLVHRVRQGLACDSISDALGGAGDVTLLIGHSYGRGVVSSGNGHSGIVALVHAPASAGDAAEAPPPSHQSFVMLERSELPTALAAEIDARLAAYLARPQVGRRVHSFWKGEPGWYLVSTSGIDPEGIDPVGRTPPPTVPPPQAPG